MTFFEFYLKYLGYDIAHASRDLERISSFSRDELNEWQDIQKWSIAKFHFDNNSLYKVKVGNKFPNNWTNMPIITKADFQHNLKSIISDEYNLNDLYIASTSGSSGHPFFFVKDKYTHAFTWALIKQRYAWHDLSFNSKQARFYGISLEKRKQYYKEIVKDKVMNRVRFPVFNLSDKVLENFMQRFNKYQFEYIYGYTNSLLSFARFLLQNNICLTNICPTLKFCITTSEVCTDEDRKILKTAFGVPVINEYGASEVGIIAFENPSGEWIISDENLYLEIVDDEGRTISDGTFGNILITDLYNKAFPIIRYKIGDLGAIKTDMDTSRDVRKKLLCLNGRQNDTIILPSGKKSPGLSFYYISRSILESTGIIREFIIHQTALDEFIFDIVSERPLNINEVNEIQKKLDLYLEPGLNLKINRVPMIKRPASGKIKHFYSELA